MFQHRSGRNSARSRQVRETYAVGQLVELKGCVEHHGVLTPTSIEVRDEKGKVEGWIADRQMYIVRTFAGLVVAAPQACVKAFEPHDVETSGGFDVVWPSARTEHSLFSKAVIEHLNDKGYCVIQMFEGKLQENDISEACKFLQWGSMQEELQNEYLGTDSVEGKVAWLQKSRQGSRGMDVCSLAEMCPNMSFDNMAGFECCDHVLTNLAALLRPHTPGFEDDKSFGVWGRTSAMVRSSLHSDEQGVERRTLDQETLDTHIFFVDSKKLCMLYLVDNEGGDLELTPNPMGYKYLKASIPLSKNKLVVFRCDSMGLSYSYRPSGQHLAVQAWALDIPSALKDKEEVLRIIDGPQEPEGRRTNVMSLTTRYPGRGCEPEAYQNMLFAGTDGQVKIPITRWDTDVYYRAEHTIGFSMSCHGGLLQQSDLELFDHNFFEVDDKEAKLLHPYMRIVMEVGFNTLVTAGHTREELNGLHCGVFFGDSGADDVLFEQTADVIPFAHSTRERSAASARLSYLFGMTGPTFSSDTACSSSLVACGVAQAALRAATPVANIRPDLKHALLIGTSVMTTAHWYILLSGPGMLSTRGRCFSFDKSADGYARGEGVGGLKLQVFDDSKQVADRVGVLIGAAINQDGRSATMTAPHGPSQSEVIRSSMKEAGVSANQITIAECHGTGTALGDPIEIGALRAVIYRDRTVPIYKTSSKSNTGHLEAAAGMQGLIKCLRMASSSCAMPNCHLRELNPNLDVEGYPLHLETEVVDTGSNSSLIGVSSFGFGGTNARADIWGHATKGHRYSITGPLEVQRGVINYQIF